ncbi:MAG TPA: hypothetical protein VGC85_07850, partial [Chthoniobacterales bacterium]
FEPALVEPDGESLVSHALFNVDKWLLDQPRSVTDSHACAIVVCLTGEVRCSGVAIPPGHFVLVPASLRNATLEPAAKNTSLLRVTLPVR